MGLLITSASAAAAFGDGEELKVTDRLNPHDGMIFPPPALLLSIAGDSVT